MKNLTRTADYLSSCLEALGFIIMRYISSISCHICSVLLIGHNSQTGGKGLPLVAFRIDPKRGLHFDEFAIAHHLRERGWVVPAYTMAPHSEKLKLMRVVVREDFSRSRCDSLVADIKATVQALMKMSESRIEAHMDHVKNNVTNARGTSNKTTKGHKKYHKEKHSLQGKTGKTHAVC